MKCFVLLMLMTSSAVFAGQITASGGSGGISDFTGAAFEDVLWSQLPTGDGYGSQYFPDMYPDYDSGCANDFEFPESTTINTIRWWGTYWNGNPGPHDSPVEIYLYNDNGSGTAPTLPQHTSAIASWMIDPGQYTEVADGGNYRCEFVFPSWVVFDANTRYWFEIRKAFPFSPMGQYGWVGSTPIIHGPGVQGFDGLGVAWWTPMSPASDLSMQLVWDPTVALERRTWGDIKALF